MVTKTHQRFAKVAPDPQRASQQLRIRFSPADPASLPILAMLEKSQYGQIKQTAAKALRIGAALTVGEEPLSAPAPKTARAQGAGRFVVSKRSGSEDSGSECVYTFYDPRQPWNRHIEQVFARCEWGQTNKTMLDLLVAGLRAMGFERPSFGASGSIEHQQEPASASRAETPPAAPAAQPQRPHGQSITIGMDPTQAQPRPAPSGATSLIKGAGRRTEQR